MTFMLKAYLALEKIMLEARAAGDSDEDGILAVMDGVHQMLDPEDIAKLDSRDSKEGRKDD